MTIVRCATENCPSSLLVGYLTTYSCRPNVFWAWSRIAPLCRCRQGISKNLTTYMVIYPCFCNFQVYLGASNPTWSQTMFTEHLSRRNQSGCCQIVNSEALLMGIPSHPSCVFQTSPKKSNVETPCNKSFPNLIPFPYAPLPLSNSCILRNSARNGRVRSGVGGR